MGTSGWVRCFTFSLHNFIFSNSRHHLFVCLLHLPAAARALMDVDSMSAEDVAKKAMKIATDMCVYTNDHYMIETMDAKPKVDDAKK